jgi:hypothetical protein
VELNSLKRNSQAAADGRWVDDIPNMPGLRLKVRGLSCFAATSLRRAKERAVSRDDRERGVIKLQVEQRIQREVMHEAILLDWEGLTNAGEPVPYSREQAAHLLLDPDYDIFAGAVAWAAGLVDTDNQGLEDDQKGNSKASLPQK